MSEEETKKIEEELNTIVNCLDLEGNVMEHRPEIELKQIIELFKSNVQSGPKYIRFVKLNGNSKQDIYWVFDDFKTQEENYKKVQIIFGKINKVEK